MLGRVLHSTSQPNKWLWLNHLLPPILKLEVFYRPPPCYRSRKWLNQLEFTRSALLQPGPTAPLNSLTTSTRIPTQPIGTYLCRKGVYSGVVMLGVGSERMRLPMNHGRHIINLHFKITWSAGTDQVSQCLLKAGHAYAVLFAIRAPVPARATWRDRAPALVITPGCNLSRPSVLYCDSPI